MATCPHCKAEMQTDGINSWCVQYACNGADDHLADCVDLDDCHMCGGSGVLDDECECSAFEDVCCCLQPMPRECPECRYHEQQLRDRQKAEAPQT